MRFLPPDDGFAQGLKLVLFLVRGYLSLGGFENCPKKELIYIDLLKTNKKKHFNSLIRHKNTHFWFF